MYLYWLCYRDETGIAVVIQPGPSLIHARMVNALAGLDEGTFVEGHELDSKTAKRVPKGKIGRRLSQRQAAQLLRLLDRKIEPKKSQVRNTKMHKSLK